MDSGKISWKIIIKKLSRAIFFFVIIALAIPLVLASLAGIPAWSVLSLISSTFILQAGAPVVGVALGISNPVIISTMFCFALGMVLAVFEICDSLASSSVKVQKWLEKVEKASEKYPQLQKYGVISCFFIAWIPPFGIYGAPVFAWIMNWKRLYAVIVIVAAFTVASVFVLFFASKIPEIMFLAANLGAVIFIITSMVTLGLSNTVAQVLEPLKDKNLIIRVLLVNFILIPALAYLLVAVLSLPTGLALGLILVGTAAGSPFLPRVMQIKAEKRSLAGGLGVLLTILSVIYIPVSVPFMVPGVALFSSILLFMTFVVVILLPLGGALYLRSGREQKVARILPWLDRTSYGAFFASFIGVMYVFFNQLTAMIGYGGLIAIIIFILAAFGIGYLLGGYEAGMQGVLGFGTAQRGLSVALVFPLLALLSNYVIPGSSDYDPAILIMILTLGLAGLIILMFLGKRLAKQGSSG
jgi:BASS family bile acid:Na+ symporter